MEQDTVQIEGPDFDPDINGLDTQRVHHNTAVVSVHVLFTSPKPESINASNTQEETTDRDQFDKDIPIWKISIGLAISLNKFQTIHQKIILWENNRSPQQTETFWMKSPH